MNKEKEQNQWQNSCLRRRKIKQIFYIIFVCMSMIALLFYIYSEFFDLNIDGNFWMTIFVSLFGFLLLIYHFITGYIPLSCPYCNKDYDDPLFDDNQKQIECMIYCSNCGKKIKKS